MSAKSVVNVPADRYFQPPSGSSATIVPHVHRLGLAGRRHEHRSARRAGEDALAEDQLAQRRQRLEVRDEVLRVDELGLEQLRDEALVERAQALDLFPGERLGRDDPDARLVLAQVPRRRPSACPLVPSPATKTSISGQSARISGPVVS